MKLQGIKSLNIDEDVHHEIKKCAVNERIDMKEMVKRMLEAYLKPPVADWGQYSLVLELLHRPRPEDPDPHIRIISNSLSIVKELLPEVSA